jgi:hypothetical protein
MAGIAVPTAMLVVILSVYAYNRFYFEVSSQFVIPLPAAPLDRVIVFPMAVVPNLWGLWNMLHLALSARLRWSIGVHGAGRRHGVLPCVEVPRRVAEPGNGNCLGPGPHQAHDLVYDLRDRHVGRVDVNGVGRYR